MKRTYAEMALNAFLVAAFFALLMAWRLLSVGYQDQPRPALLKHVSLFVPLEGPAMVAEVKQLPRRARRPARRPETKLAGGAKCLASAIYFEARDQTIEGRLAVADVIMRRVESSRWPNTVCGVVLQKHQFSFVTDGRLPKEHEVKARWYAARLAAKIFDGDVALPLLDADHYHRTDTHPYWSKGMKKIAIIGDHIFFKEGPRT